ncbi:MAG: hypothetical protein RL653_3824 [Pseudomonadota bacterium]|jgi:hypothetical protein
MMRPRTLLVLLLAAAAPLGCTESTPPAARDAGPGGDGGAPTPTVDAGWRSALYPEDWTPGFTAADGRFLHDFSYAGYRAGEVPLPEEDPPPRIDAVSDFGADPDGGVDATAALQAALDAAGADGGTVYLPAGDYRVDGLLKMERPGVVLAGAGVGATRLHFRATAATAPALAYGAHLQVGGPLSYGVDVPLASDAAARSFELQVDAGDGLAPGDEVALGWNVTDAWVAEHGMQGYWDTPTFAFHGTWQPFAFRTVVSVDTSSLPHRVRLDVPLRLPAKVRDGASLRRVTGWTREVGLRGFSFTNACSESDAWAANQVHAIQLRGVQDGWVRDVSSFSPAGDGAHLQSSGLLAWSSRRVTIRGVQLGPVQNRGSGGNGYLFELRQANEVLTSDCTATGGRHNFIQNWELGTSGCVWLRVTSRDGRAQDSRDSPFSQVGHSETHRALAHANLFDGSVFADGLSLVNRARWSSNAGHTATENVAWNCSGNGTGQLRSYQFGHGYVVGARGFEAVVTALDDLGAALRGQSAGTAPEDTVEGAGEQEPPTPASLYEDQRARRLGR